MGTQLQDMLRFVILTISASLLQAATLDEKRLNSQFLSKKPKSTCGDLYAEAKGECHKGCEVMHHFWDEDESACEACDLRCVNTMKCALCNQCHYQDRCKE